MAADMTREVEIYNQVCEAVMRYDLETIRGHFDKCPAAFRLPAPNNELINLAQDYPNREIFEFVIKSGCELNIANDAGCHLGHCLGEMDDRAEVEALIQILCQNGWDPNFQHGAPSSALHCAACWNKPWLVQMLVQYGADVNLRSPQIESCVTPLMSAAFFGHVEVVRKLLELGADPTLRDSLGMTALDRARSRAHLSCVRELKRLVPNSGETNPVQWLHDYFEMVKRNLYNRTVLTGDFRLIVQALWELQTTGIVNPRTPELAGIDKDSVELTTIVESVQKLLARSIFVERDPEPLGVVIDLLRLYRNPQHILGFSIALRDELRRLELTGSNIHSLLMALGECGEQDVISQTRNGTFAADLEANCRDAENYLRRSK